MSATVLDALGVERERVVALVADLRLAHRTVATAESLTAGLLCAAMTEVAGASAVLRGGLVVYATDLKSGLAGVEEGVLAAHGPVHPEVAAQLARGARARCGSTWGVGLTGVAGPEQQSGAAVGTVYLALAAESGTVSREYRFPGGRHVVRGAAVRAAIELLRDAVQAPEPEPGDYSGDRK